MSDAPPPIIEKHGGAPHSKRSLRLWLRLLSCSTVIEKRIRQNLIDRFDTTLPRFDVLATLDRAPDGLTMGELSTALLVSGGNVTTVVARLIDDGHVERITSQLDRRSITVRLTAQGRADFRAMATAHEGWVEQYLSDLSDADIDALLDGLNRVRASVERNKA
ncbi:MarR family winged helix-turn-helix transcriptional regulator [Sphingomonas sp. KC8]|uniref:MarR family winged helix-turn-helix transcriptional regulator n=1 Tax=Sphingomonas sp. KC8 TaxID=1030157 RepID=UPI000248AB62|nr:MarR family transcriptional regulator [Sphingomonas sp. KC8]ARS27285.1 transcriptional regulator [Sphingomonas sp. KC8]